MQGISTSKHRHLVDALLHLEKLFNEDFVQDGGRQRSAELREELEAMLGSYNRQVEALAELIGDYQELFNKTKTQFLSPKLKELRKQTAADKPVFSVILENIRLVYGT